MTRDKPTRQQLNQALFTRVLLGPHPDQIRIELNDDYDALISARTTEASPKTH